MMSSSKHTAAAGAVGGKAARACDSCLRRRARWYCAADDAFLCQGCDASVHSANPLARRHERLRLRPATDPPLAAAGGGGVGTTTTWNSKKRQKQQVAPAAWSRRKARTRRPHVKSVGQLLSRKLVVVPEVSSATTTTTVESSEEERKAGEEEEEGEEEQLLYCVPTFDRALAELCSPPPPAADDPTAATASSSSWCRDDAVDGAAVENTKAPPPAPVAVAAESPVQQLPDSFAGGFGPTDAELREFAADMEALLGQGLDDGNELDRSFYLESLGLMTPQDKDDLGRVKMEFTGSARGEGRRSRIRAEAGGVVGRGAGHGLQLLQQLAGGDGGQRRRGHELRTEGGAAGGGNAVLEEEPGSQPQLRGHHRELGELAVDRRPAARRPARRLLAPRPPHGVDGGRRTAGRGGGGDCMAGDGRRRARGAGDTVPGEAADEAVRQEDKVRGAEAQRGEAAADEGPLRQATCRRRRCRRRRSCRHCRPVRRHLASLIARHAVRACRRAVPVRADD